jgi:PAS domain S-box-containing protein
VAVGVQGVTGVERGAAQRYLLCTSDGTYLTSLGGAWQEVLGWTEKELMSRPFADFVHPRDRQRTMQEAGNVARPGYEVVGFENRFRARHGRWRRLRWSARTDGTCWVGMAIEVSDDPGTAPIAGSRPWRPAHPEPSLPRPVAVSPPRSPAVGAHDYARRGWGPPVATALCLLVAIVAVNPPGFGLSGATSEPAWSGREAPPVLIGPVNGAGPLQTSALAIDPSSGLLGPRPEPPGSLHR